jgi:hypothetical protein
MLVVFNRRCQFRPAATPVTERDVGLDVNRRAHDRPRPGFGVAAANLVPAARTVAVIYLNFPRADTGQTSSTIPSRRATISSWRWTVVSE